MYEFKLINLLRESSLSERFLTPPFIWYQFGSLCGFYKSNFNIVIVFLANPLRRYGRCRSDQMKTYVSASKSSKQTNDCLKDAVRLNIVFS